MRAFKYKRVFFLLMAPVAYGLSSLSSNNPYITEKIYSTGIYPIISGILGRITGLLPFSLAELLILLFAAGTVIFLCYQIISIIKQRTGRKDRAIRLMLNIFVFLSVWYGSFVLLCGFNYNRLSFTSYSGLYVRDSSTEELIAICGELAEKANTLRLQVEADEYGIMRSSFQSQYEAAKYAGNAFNSLGDEYTVLSGYTPRPKPVVVSKFMSMLNITGIYIPFTFEANVNVDTIDYTIPSAMMHELAHYKGFMREDEANFISYLACLASGNADFEYSGVMLALIHSTNALYSSDRDTFYGIMDTLLDDVKADISADSAYWKQFEGPVAEVSTAVNNTYLRVNRQSDGVKSYGRMVDLLLADYRMRHGFD